MIAAATGVVELDAQERDRRTRALLPLVARLSRGLVRMYSFADEEDLFQDGCVGMMRAIERFDPERGVPLEAYARPIIAGAIFNGIRSRDPLSENARKLLRDAERERAAAAATGGSEPTMREMAARISGLGAALLMAHRAKNVSLDGPLPPGESVPVDWSQDPASIAADRERVRSVRAALERLTERQRDVVRHYYYGRRSVTVVGEKMNISAQRVSQLHASAIANLRKALASA